MRMIRILTIQVQRAFSALSKFWCTINCPRPHGAIWFIALWGAGVLGAALLALPFRLLMKVCMQ